MPEQIDPVADATKTVVTAYKKPRLLLKYIIILLAIYGSILFIKKVFFKL